MSRTIIYTRVSTAKQARSGLGLEAQEQECRAYAAREGWEVAGVFTDAGVSGTTPVSKRPGLLDALGELRRGDRLLVASRDRLARDQVMIAVLLQRLTEARGVTVISIKGEGLGDFGSPAERAQAKLLGVIIDAVAEFEAALAGIRTSAAKAAARRRGEYTGGKVPWGQRLVEGRLLPDIRELEASQLAVLTLREYQTHGKMPLRPLGRVLIEQGFGPRSGRDSWSPESIKAVLGGGGVDWETERAEWLANNETKDGAA